MNAPNIQAPRISKRKRLFFALIGALLTLCVMEGILQSAVFFFPRLIPLLFPHRVAEMYSLNKKVGHRPTPYYEDHDAKGWRNARVPRTVEVVAMGDSQTYGAGVPRESAWPQQLERLAGVATYNLAFGGYSPAHSLLLLDEALAFKPKLVIEAFYSGNDLYDGYHIVYDLHLLPELKSTDPVVLQKCAALEAVETLDHISYRTGDRLSTSSAKTTAAPANNASAGEANSPPSGGAPAAPKPDATAAQEPAPPPEAAPAPEPPGPTALRVFLAENSALYGLARALFKYRPPPPKPKPLTWEEIKQEFGGREQFYQVFDGGKGRAVFMSAYRLCALDLEDARIREGLRIQFEAIRRMNERLEQAHVRFVVLMVPTTELVFSDLVESRKANVGEDYRRLIANEKVFWERTRVFLKEQDIPAIGALPALRASLNEGRQPYPEDANGHPNAIGYEAIAREVSKHLKTLLRE